MYLDGGVPGAVGRIRPAMSRWSGSYQAGHDLGGVGRIGLAVSLEEWAITGQP